MSNFRGDSVRFVQEFISMNALNLRGFGGVTTTKHKRNTWVITANSAQQIPNFTSKVITPTNTILVSTTNVQKIKEQKRRENEKREKG